jgi:OmpA-OmpF porin, OOP family
MRWVVFLAALVATGLLPHVAVAQMEAADPVPSLDLRGFAVPTDPQSSLALEPATTPGSGNWNVGAWASYARSPVVTTDPAGRDRDVIAHQFTMDYLANVGIGSRFALGLVLPAVVYQSGDDVSDALPGSEPLPMAALGDLGLVGKATVLSPTDLGGFGLAVLGRVTAPTGGRTSYLSEEGFRGGGAVLGELSLLAISLRASAGARLRSQPRRLIDDGTDQYEFGHDLPWAAGVVFRPQILGMDPLGRWRWHIEARGAASLTPAFARGPQSPALVSASARYTAGDFSILGGIEVPVNDAVGNPWIRPVIAIGWAPRFEDEDGDGIPDDEDECPELPEDRDGFEDEDGCPDFDDDDDGVPDDMDRCPGEVEDADGFEDDDGCPDPDNDGDGVLDGDDACPDERGPPGGPRPGCPPRDSDGDGIPDDRDACPEQPEDRDGFQDEDGCPDPDDDGDGIPDDEDACPREPGIPQPDTDRHGCPSPDADGDALVGADDRCPDEPEDYNGEADDDGCPDEATLPPARQGRRLASVAWQGGRPILELAEPLRFAGDAPDPRSMATLRAIAQVLNAHPEWILAVGTRPLAATAAAQQTALNRSLAVAIALRALTYRDNVAEAVGWPAVRDEPGAARQGMGLLLLVPRAGAGSP